MLYLLMICHLKGKSLFMILLAYLYTPTFYELMLVSIHVRLGCANWSYALGIMFWWVMVHMHWCLCLDELLPWTLMIMSWWDTAMYIHVLFGFATVDMYWGLYSDKSLSLCIGVYYHIPLLVSLCGFTFELIWQVIMGCFDDKDFSIVFS